MSEASDAPDMAQPAPNPDAQTTVNDFLDYTEFFPSDLVRSLTLIGDLDATYHDAVQRVHELTVLYGDLPNIAEQARPDPAALRKQIAQELKKAVHQRTFAFAEAARLYEVTVRHCKRSSIIKRKLQEQPEPPSRDPTPPPISPSLQRPVHRTYEIPPHLRPTLEGARQAANASRPRDRLKKPARPASVSSRASDDDSDIFSQIDLAPSERKHKPHRDRAPKTSRSRAPGVLGTNVHSSIAGISTSNALAQLMPPPADARPGSKWAPWMKLTEYEMAVLRKQMKKNAVWEPSQTMVNRELERKHRTRADYEREKARCEATGENFVDEQPESLHQIATAEVLVPAAPQLPPSEPPVAPPEPVQDAVNDDVSSISPSSKPNEAKDDRKLDRLSQRQKAIRDAQELVDATERISEAANGLKELELRFGPHSVATPSSQKKKSVPRSTNKRKRDSSLPPTHEEVSQATREESAATPESTIKPPDAKKAKLQLILPGPEDTMSPALTPASALSSPGDAPASIIISPTVNTPVPLPETSRTTINASTVQVPLAPAGPSTPKISKSNPKVPSRQPTPAAISPVETRRSPIVAIPSSMPFQANVTAASSRPRRESVVPKAPSPTTSVPQTVKKSESSTPAPEPSGEISTLATRPRSARGHVPTPKAQSEEPKPNEVVKSLRETRRHSIFSQSALSHAPATRTSARRKPPPTGEVTSAEDGQKTVTNVKRAQGSKNKKKKKSEEEMELADDIDPDEPRYCFCDDVSFGQMISCDNKCDREWFHLPCVGMTDADIPSRRSKWYCPDCRASLGTDAYGNPLVPPPLPGRRGNRGWST